MHLHKAESKDGDCDGPSGKSTRMDSETSMQMGDELPPMDEGTTLSMDGNGTICLDEAVTICIDEAGTIHTDLSPVAPSIDRNAVIN